MIPNGPKRQFALTPWPPNPRSLISPRLSSAYAQQALLPSFLLLLEFEAAQMRQAPGFAGAGLQCRYELLQQL